MATAAEGVAREIVVDAAGKGDFATINAAVAAAGAGDVVTVRQGTYHETVYIDRKHGTADRPIVLQGDPAAPAGSVIVDGARPAPLQQWQRFTSEQYGVTEEHNVWQTGHDPGADCTGDELTLPGWPYLLHRGYYIWQGSEQRKLDRPRWGTCGLFRGERRLQLVPAHKKMGLMSDKYHADIEETQSEEYITAAHAKFLQPGEWIWYDDGRTDGSDEDYAPVDHPAELQHRIFVRLADGQIPTEMSYTVKANCIWVTDSSNVIIRRLRVRRGQTCITVTDSAKIRMENLIVEEFGGSRKFRPAITGKGIPRIHIYQGGYGILLNRSPTELVGCVIQNGLETGVNVNGVAGEADGLKMLYCTIRNIGRHPWGGSWFHGNGEGFSTGSMHNIMVARSVIENCTNTSIWLDNYPNRGNCKNVRIIDNTFRNIDGMGIFSELRIDDVLIAYNVFDTCRRGGVRIGPVARRNRVLGNLFHNIDHYAGHLCVYSRTEGRTDTVEYLAVAGNVFSRSKYNFLWSEMSLTSPNQYFDRNVWHAWQDGNDAKGRFLVHELDTDLAGAWNALRSPRFAAAGENSKAVSQSPVTRDPAGKLRSNPDPASLVDEALLGDLQSKGFLTQDERDFLAGVAIPADWAGPGAPLAAEAKQK